MNIDRIARAMVDVEPSADLEARIRARLGAARPARVTAWWAWRIGAPLAAAAAIALALVVQGPGSRSLPAEAAPAGAVAQAGPGVQSPATSSLPGLKTRPPKISSAASRPKDPASLLSAEEVAWMERRMPALDPVIALQMDRLLVDSIQPEPLAITPLTISPVGTDGAGTTSGAL